MPLRHAENKILQDAAGGAPHLPLSADLGVEDGDGCAVGGGRGDGLCGDGEVGWYWETQRAEGTLDDSVVGEILIGI